MNESNKCLIRARKVKKINYVYNRTNDSFTVYNKEQELNALVIKKQTRS